MQDKSPREIHMHLLLNVPGRTNANTPLSKIVDFVKHNKERLLSATRHNTMGELAEFCAAHVLDPTKDDVEMGVLPNYNLSVNQANDGKVNVQVGLTSIALMRQHITLQEHGQLPSFVVVDDTYNTNAAKFPLQIIGTTDVAGHFRLLAVFVQTNEDTEAQMFGMASLKAAFKDFLAYEWNPAFGLSDAAVHVKAALKSCFPGIVLATCYFHLTRGLVKNQSKFRDRENYVNFSADVRSLHELSSKAVFVEGVDLLCKRYQDQEGGAVAWFRDSWGREDLRDWYIGALPGGLPTSNNAMESGNALLKKFVTCRKQQSIGIFLQKMKNEIKYLGRRADELSLHPTLDADTWKNAQVMLREIGFSKGFFKVGRLFFVPSSHFRAKFIEMSVKERGAALKQWRKLQPDALHGESVQDFVARHNSFYCLSPLSNEEADSPIKFSCSCPAGMKKLSCKHALGLAISSKLVEVPPNLLVAVPSKIGVKRGRAPAVGKQKK
jgi:hypothetical protein